MKLRLELDVPVTLAKASKVLQKVVKSKEAGDLLGAGNALLELKQSLDGKSVVITVTVYDEKKKKWVAFTGKVFGFKGKGVEKPLKPIKIPLGQFDAISIGSLLMKGA